MEINKTRKSLSNTGFQLNGYSSSRMILHQGKVEKLSIITIFIFSSFCLYFPSKLITAPQNTSVFWSHGCRPHILYKCPAFWNYCQYNFIRFSHYPVFCYATYFVLFLLLLFKPLFPPLKYISYYRNSCICKPELNPLA